MQPERCTYRCKHVYARVYGFQHVRTESCTCRAEVSGAPIVCSLRGAPIARERCGTCTPYVYEYSVWHGAVQLLHVSAHALASTVYVYVYSVSHRQPKRSIYCT